LTTFTSRSRMLLGPLVLKRLRYCATLGPIACYRSRLPLCPGCVLATRGILRSTGLMIGSLRCTDSCSRFLREVCQLQEFFVALSKRSRGAFGRLKRNYKCMRRSQLGWRCLQE